MEYKFVPMTEDHAKHMIAEWQYEKEIAFHNYSNEAEHLLDRESWGNGLFAVLDETDQLIGELTIAFFDEKDDFVEYKYYCPDLLNRSELWIGFGLRPDLTGKGHGTDFVSACMRYAVGHHQYQGDHLFLGVPAFNQRAIKVYEKLGFKAFNRVDAEVNDFKFVSVQMKRVNDFNL